MTQSELEQQVRLALQTAIADDRHRRCRRPTGPASRRRSPTTSSATDRSSRCCATPTCPRSWSTRSRTSTSSASGKLVQDRTPRSPTRRTCVAPSTRSSSKIGRRVDETSPMVRRPPARRHPCQRDHPAAGARRVEADDPKVLRGPLHRRGPDQLRHAHARVGEPARGVRARAASTSSSPAARAPARPPRSTCCRRSSPTTSASSPSRTPPSSGSGQDHVLRLESRPPNIEGKGAVTIRDLVKNSLRMRPDRVVVGEIRDAAALDMLQAMNTGHDGSISTLHANTPRDALARLETMVLMAGMDLPVRAIREQVASAVDLIIQQTRLKDGTRRITAITEIVGMEGDIITTQDVFLFDYAAGVDENGKFQGGLKSMGLRPRFLERLTDHGVHVDPAVFATGGGCDEGSHARGSSRPRRSSRRDPRLGAACPPTPRTRSTSTTSRPRTATVSMRARRRRRPERRRRRPSTRRRRGRRPSRSTPSAKTVAAGDVERDDRAGARRQQQHGQGGKFAAATAAVDAFLDAAPEDVADRPRHVRRRPGHSRSSRRPTTTPFVDALADVELRKRHQRVRRHRRGRRAASATTGRARSSSCPTAPTPAATTTLEVVTNDAADDGRRRRRRVARAAARAAGDHVRPRRRHRRAGDPGRARRARLGLLRPGRRARLAAARHLRAARRRLRRGDRQASASTRRRHDVHRLRLRDLESASAAAAPEVVEPGKAADRHARHAPGRARVRARTRRRAGHRARRRTEQVLGASGVSTPTSTAAARRRAAASRRTPGQPTSRTPRSRSPTKVVSETSRPASPSVWPVPARRSPPSEWLLLHAAIAVGAALVGFVLGGRRPRASSASLLGVVAAVVLPQVPAPPTPQRLQRAAGRDARPDGRWTAGRSLAAPGRRHRRP